MIQEKEKIITENGGLSRIRNYSPKTVFWGVAPTGDIHLGYLPYIAFLKYLKSNGSRIIIFIGDYHAYLDANKVEFDKLSLRSQYYRKTFLDYGFVSEEIISAREEYIKKEYIKDLFYFSNYLPSRTLLEYANKTLANSQSGLYTFGDMLYVATQIFDLKYFNVDLILCGVDESGIYQLGIPIIEKVYGNWINFLFFPRVRGVVDEEMHASNQANNKITIGEKLDSIFEKLKRNQRLLNDIKKYVFPLWDIDIKDTTSIELAASELYKICNGKRG